MKTTPAWRAAVLVLGIVLLLAATPATAEPPDRSDAEEPCGLSFFRSLGAWLTALWPAGHGAEPSVASWLATDGGGGFPLETPPAVETTGGPTGDPERGSVLDPDG